MNNTTKEDRPNTEAATRQSIRKRNKSTIENSNYSSMLAHEMNEGRTVYSGQNDLGSNELFQVDIKLSMEG